MAELLQRNAILGGKCRELLADPIQYCRDMDVHPLWSFPEYYTGTPGRHAGVLVCARMLKQIACGRDSRGPEFPLCVLCG